MKFVSIIFFITLLTGCASAGPMQTMMGPMNTPAFEPIVLDVVQDGSKSIRFKEWTTMYENDSLQLWGVFFITDKGAYMASWDTRGFQYNLRYKLLASELAAIEDRIIQRDMWVDSNLLVLKDKNGHSVGFALNGKNAARSILREIQAK